MAILIGCMTSEPKPGLGGLWLWEYMDVDKVEWNINQMNSSLVPDSWGAH